MPLFEANMTWSQFKRGEIVEILDEDLPKFERAITPRSEGGLGRLKPYTEGDVIPPLHDVGEASNPAYAAEAWTSGGVERPDPTRVIDETVEPPDPGPQE